MRVPRPAAKTIALRIKVGQGSFAGFDAHEVIGKVLAFGACTVVIAIGTGHDFFDVGAFAEGEYVASEAGSHDAGSVGSGAAAGFDDPVGAFAADLQIVAQAVMGFKEDVSEEADIPISHGTDGLIDPGPFTQCVAECVGVAFDGALAAEVVFVAGRAGFFGAAQTVGNEEGPFGGDGFGFDSNRVEADAEGAAAASGETDGVVHAAASGAYEHFAIGKDFHEFAEAGGDAAGFEQGQRDGNEEGRGGTESGGGGEGASDEGVDAGAGATERGDGLCGGFGVIAEIASGPGGKGIGPFEGAGSIGGGGDADDGIGAGCGVDGDVARYGHGENGEAEVIDVFADEVDATGNSDH